ncbi:MAG: DUF4412 domain-containing protein [Sphingobacteriales bacterium]|nr:MAG: DUF4412 domain-containing protein [Sphingobacteriales bacterium]
MKRLLFVALIIAGNISAFAQEKEVHDAMEKKYGEPGKEKLNEWLNSMNGKVAAEYSFPMSVDMTMENYRNGKLIKLEQMTIFVNNDKGLFATKMNDDKGKNQMMMIVDQEHGNIVMLNEKEKTAMAINTQVFMRSNNYSEVKDKAGSVDCKKTGKTKTIAGYACEEYVCTNTERQGRYEIFVTDKVKFDFTNNDGRNNPFAEYFKQAAGLGGMMMEGKFYEKEKLQATVTVNSVNMNANYNISTESYKTGMH